MPRIVSELLLLQATDLSRMHEYTYLYYNSYQCKLKVLTCLQDEARRATPQELILRLKRMEAAWVNVPMMIHEL